LVWFRSTPLRTGFTDPLSEPPTFPTHLAQPNLAQPKPVPPLRIKLRSARYRRAALSLCYGGMAEPGRIERLTLRSLRCSRPLEEPTSAGSNWRKAAGADPQTFRSHSVSNGSPGPPGITFLVFVQHLMAERDRHRTIGHRRPPSTSNTVEEPTSARSEPADGTLDPQAASRFQRAPGVFRTCHPFMVPQAFYGTPGPIRTDTARLLRPVPPTVGLLGQILSAERSAHALIRARPG
jgi:hypothetical protein